MNSPYKIIFIFLVTDNNVIIVNRLLLLILLIILFVMICDLTLCFIDFIQYMIFDFLSELGKNPETPLSTNLPTLPHFADHILFHRIEQHKKFPDVHRQFLP